MARVKRREETTLFYTVQEAINMYLHSAHFEMLQPRSQDVYEVPLQNFGNWCGTHTVTQNSKTKAWTAIESDDDQIMLHQINSHVMRLFLEHIKATGTPHKPGAEEMSSYTLANYARVTKTFLNWCAVDDEYQHQVSLTVVARIEMPSIVETIIRPFTDEQIRDLFEACDKEASEHLQIRNKAILAVMLDTGVRANELVTLEISNVSLDAKEAYIRVLGKGSKWGEVGLGEQSRRLLQKYLRMFRIPTIEDELKQEHKNLSPKQFKKLSDQAIAHEPVFMSRTARPLTVGGLEQMFERLGQWAHIEGVRCSPHTMRHSFAVRFWQRTHDIRTLSKLLRHSSISTTEHYLKSILQSEARQGAPSVFDDLNSRVNVSKKRGRDIDNGR